VGAALSERKKRLRDEFIESRGYWNELWNGVLELDEDFFEAYLRFSSVPWKCGPLEPKVKELVYIAMDAAATHLYEPGIRQHVRLALQYGATAAEIVEVLELTATLGIHACTVGVPILVEELEAAGQPLSRELTGRMRDVKADFERTRGYWNPFWDELLLLDPDFFDAYTRFSGVPWTSGVLEPKVKELIYTAFDVAATHLYQPGLRQHIRNALGYGATREEIMEVIELVSVLGIHACTVGVPILVEELAAHR
jgi:alkylhydroperoxidase/carboxymuconolactone decarboxylase family protein YurZ